MYGSLSTLPLTHATNLSTTDAISSLLAGVNGLVEFQAEAARRKWRVTSVLRFAAEKTVNVTSQLYIIEQTG